MRPNVDPADDIDEARSERMNFRTKPHVKAAIKRAAALVGLDDSAFAMSAAYSAALETIAAHEHTWLTPADHAVFFDALDNPRPPTDGLKKALLVHAALVGEK